MPIRIKPNIAAAVDVLKVNLNVKYDQQKSETGKKPLKFELLASSEVRLLFQDEVLTQSEDKALKEWVCMQKTRDIFLKGTCAEPMFYMYPRCSCNVYKTMIRSCFVHVSA